MLLKELASELEFDNLIQYRLKFTKGEKQFFDHIHEDLQDLKNTFMEHDYVEESEQISTHAVNPPMVINSVTLTVFENQPISLNELIKKYKKYYPTVETPDDIEKFLDDEIVDIIRKSYYPTPIFKTFLNALIKRYVSSFKLNKSKLPKETIMLTLSNTNEVKQLKKELKKSAKFIKGDEIKTFWHAFSKLVLEPEENDETDILTHISAHHFNPETTRLLNHVINVKNDANATLEYHKAENDLKYQLTDDYMTNNDKINELIKSLLNVPKQYKNSPDVVTMKNKINALKHQNDMLINAGGHNTHFSLTWINHYHHLQSELLKSIDNNNPAKVNELLSKLSPNSNEHNKLKTEIFKMFDNMLQSDKPKDNGALLKGFNYYKKFKDSYFDDLNDKHIVIVDDHPKEYINEVIKVLYFCGIIPKSIMMVVV